MKWSEAKEVFKNIEHLCKLGFTDSLRTYLPQADRRNYEHLERELKHVDFERLAAHRQALSNPESRRLSMEDLKPFRFQKQKLKQTIKPDTREKGRQMLADGVVAEAILAGGAATRFFKGQRGMPKALYPISPVAGKTFLDIFLQEAARVAADYGVAPPILIMVSEVTAGAIRKYIEQHDLFGLPRDCIFIFQQDHHPRLDHDGNLVIKPDGSLVWYGDGHGGIYTALIKSGLRARLMAAGVSTVVLHNVDNPLARPFDVKRLGVHASGHKRFTLTVYRRLRPEQKVGVVAKMVKTRAVEVIEYSEADPELMGLSDKNGLLFDCGHVNTNCFDLSVIREDVPPALYRNKPLEINGKVIASSTFEVLNQHLTRQLPGRKVGVFAGDQQVYFLPTKNLVGEDSVETTRAFLSAMGMKMLNNIKKLQVHGNGQVADLSPVMDADSTGRMFEYLELFDRSQLYLSPVDGPGFRGKVIIRKQGKFILDSLHPFGVFKAGPHRKVSREIAPPMVDVQGNVEVGKDAELVIKVEAGAEFKPAGNLRLADGEKLEIHVSRGEIRDKWR